jgi:putative ABC transport system permease protein
MTALLRIAWRSLRNRGFTAALTVLTVALSVMLLLGVERLREQTRESFLRSVSGTDLIVGARAHPVQLLLYSVFRMGDATNNMRWESYQKIATHPAVAWSVPISLGDSHRGFRVVGTTPAYFRHVGYSDGRRLRFAQGRAFAGGADAEQLFEAVIGADVAERLGYDLSSRIVLAHGTARVNIHKHEDRPFAVVGVLQRTGTPADQGIYVSLQAIEAIHLNWRGGIRIARGAPDTALTRDALRPRSVTAAYIGLRSKIAVFSLQQAINRYDTEPLSAILPGVALQMLWGMLGTVERAMLIAAGCVVAAGLMVVLTTILATLNERRREMAILRAVGAGPRHVFGLLLIEAAVLAAAGAMLGLLLTHAGFWLLSPWLQSRYGLFLPPAMPDAREWRLLATIVAAGIGVGLLPAFLAYRRSLQDGMTVSR